MLTKSLTLPIDMPRIPRRSAKKKFVLAHPVFLMFYIMTIWLIVAAYWDSNFQQQDPFEVTCGDPLPCIPPKINRVLLWACYYLSQVCCMIYVASFDPIRSIPCLSRKESSKMCPCSRAKEGDEKYERFNRVQRVYYFFMYMTYVPMFSYIFEMCSGRFLHFAENPPVVECVTVLMFVMFYAGSAHLMYKDWLIKRSVAMELAQVRCWHDDEDDAVSRGTESLDI